MHTRSLLACGVAVSAGTLLALSGWGRGAHAPTTGNASPVQAPRALAPIAPALAVGAAAAPRADFQRVELLEVVVSRSGRELALLRVQGGAPQRFSVGDVVGSGIRLVRILPHMVELQRGAVLERVLADARSLAPHPRAAALPYGADAAPLSRVQVSDVVVSAVDLPLANSHSLDRAIARARVP